MDTNDKINHWSKEDKPIVSKLRKFFNTIAELSFRYTGKRASYTLYMAGDKDKDFLYRLKDNDNFKSIPCDFGVLVLASKIASEHKGERCIIIDAYPKDAPIPESDEEYMDNVCEYIYLVDSSKLIFYHQTPVKEGKEITNELQGLIDSIGI